MATKSSIRRAIALSAAVTSAATALTLAPTSAQAATTATLTSPACGRVLITTGGAYAIHTDALGAWKSTGAATKLITGRPAGTYRYFVTNVAGTTFYKSASVTVKPCSSRWMKRPVRNDLNGDRRGDLLAVASNGSLNRYLVNSSLKPTAHAVVSKGWAGVSWLGQADEVNGPGTGSSYLVGAMPNGTLYAWHRTGTSIGRAVRIGAGFVGYNTFALLPVNNAFLPGSVVLLAGNATTVRAYRFTGTSVVGLGIFSTPGSRLRALLAAPDFNGDGWADVVMEGRTGITVAMLLPALSYSRGSAVTVKRISSNWTGLRLLQASDENGDGYTDIVAIDSSSTLRVYLNNRGTLGSSRVMATGFRGITHLS